MGRPSGPGDVTNRELMDRIERVERTLEKVLVEHTATHQLIDSSISELQHNATLCGERMTGLQRAMPELAELHDFRIQVTTLSRTAQWIFGGSLLAAVAAIVSLIMSLSHLMAATP